MVTMRIRLGDKLSVDAVEYASRANAILGIRDSGKTYTGTLIAEQLHDCGIPFFAFDPIGRWRFLRSPGTGDNGRGFPIVVAGGAAPDLPLTPASAAQLIRAAMRSGVSMVIDLYSVALSKKDWRAIVRHSIETILYEGEGHGQRHVFLEEAAEFVPQRVHDGQTYAAVEKLARMGGNVGVGVTLINQRAEEVNKAVLELCDNLLLHRQRGKNSLLSLRKWLDAGNIKPPKEITDSLSDLPTGQCWVWFKELGRPRLIHIARKQSFDPDRRAMSKTHAKAAPAAVDVSSFIARMKAALAGKPQAPQEDQVNQKEAAELRATNEKLQRQVAALQDEIARLRGEGPRAPALSAPATGVDGLDIEALYAEIKRRLTQEPALLRIALTKPEIEIAVKRQVIAADGVSALGMVARLIADGWFNDAKTSTAAWNEVKRYGFGGVAARIYEACEKLTSMGFLTSEGKGIGYRAVPDMKINIVEREAA
jgi:hypothetical protein